MSKDREVREEEEEEEEWQGHREKGDLQVLLGLLDRQVLLDQQVLYVHASDCSMGTFVFYTSFICYH